MKHLARPRQNNPAGAPPPISNMSSFHIISLFPQFFDSPLQTGLIGKAKNNGLLSFSFHNPRDFACNRHHHVDKPPFGGGPGMVIQAEPIACALRSIPEPGKIILLTPGGKPYNGAIASNLANEGNITIICGRYEGIDARLGKAFPVQEFSVGDAILNGGETAALFVIESIARFLPGFLGDEASAMEESMTDNLLEYPQFTRPEVWEGFTAPVVLLSGNHAQIKKWRRQEAVTRTYLHRPDLLDKAHLTFEDSETINSIPSAKAGRNLGFCLVHHPVILEKGRIGTASLTNLDIHDIARISHSYGMGPFYAVTPLKDQLQILKTLLGHWLGKPHTDRAAALSLVRPVETLQEAIKSTEELYGKTPFLVGTSAKLAAEKYKLPQLTAGDILDICKKDPVLLILGTARGLEGRFIKNLDGLLRPIRFLNENHLSVRSAAAIIADRILGDYN